LIIEVARPPAREGLPPERGERVGCAAGAFAERAGRDGGTAGLHEGGGGHGPARRRRGPARAGLPGRPGWARGGSRR